MRNTIRWALRLALFSTAFILVGAGAASAEESTIQVEAPASVCEIEVNVADLAVVDLCAGADVDAAADIEAGPITAGPLVGANQVDAVAPVDVCGIGIGIAADTSADCATEVPTATPSAPSPASGDTDGTATDARSGDALLVGPTDADAAVPANLCGIGVGIAGDTQADCSGETAPPTSEIERPVMADESLVGPADVGAATPVNLCGIGVGVLGSSGADCSGAATAAADGSGSSAADSVTSVDATAPASVCGIGVGVLGTASSECASAAAPSGPADQDDPSGPADGPTEPATMSPSAAGLFGMSAPGAAVRSAAAGLADSGLVDAALGGAAQPARLPMTGTSPTLLWLAAFLVAAGAATRTARRSLR